MMRTLFDVRELGIDPHLYKVAESAVTACVTCGATQSEAENIIASVAECFYAGGITRGVAEAREIVASVKVPT